MVLVDIETDRIQVEACRDASTASVDEGNEVLMSSGSEIGANVNQ